MIKGKTVLLVSPTTSSFTHPLSQALSRMGLIVFNFYDDRPTIVTRIVGLLINITGSGLLFREYHKYSLNQSLSRKIVEICPDYLLVIKGINIDRQVINDAREKKVATINWFPDCQDVWEWIEVNAQNYQYFFTCCLDMLPRLRKIGVKAFYLPYAGDPDRKIKKRPKKYNVVFVGQYTKRREDYFQTIRDLGLDIWGYEGWKKSSLSDCYHGRLYVDEAKEVFRQSKIVVNMTTSEKENGFAAANLRNFEVTGVGTLLITQYNEALSRLFENGKEVVFFETHQELREKVKYYLSHEAEREKIARAGWQKVVKEHTFDKRFKDMFQKIKL